MLKGKLVKRSVSLKSIAGGEPKQIGGGRSQAVFTLNEGIAQEAAKELAKFIKDEKLKVQVSIQGDQPGGHRRSQGTRLPAPTPVRQLPRLAGTSGLVRLS